MAPGVFDSEILGLRTLEHLLRVSRTWDSTVSLLPKGGETIWGNLDWSPEEGHGCDFTTKGEAHASGNSVNNVNQSRGLEVKDLVKYGRIISFGKAASQLPSSQLPNIDPKV